MNSCDWLHKKLEDLPFINYPFNLESLPRNGIYFFYEKDEASRHNGVPQRIVRVGTHKGNNFRSRMNDHFLFNERKMNFSSMKSAPKDRSIFRKNIGRAILNKNNDDYLKIWDIDFTPRKNRDKYHHLRDIHKEKEIETRITNILRDDFSFRFFLIDDESKRIGNKGLESLLIGTIAKCELCAPSEKWLGNYSPVNAIRNSGLWLSQHLQSDIIDEKEKMIIIDAVDDTINWFERR